MDLGPSTSQQTIMNYKFWPALIASTVAACFLLCATLSQASTTLLGPSLYRITEGVAFTLGNNGSSAFTFNWTDPGTSGASRSNIADPTLVLTLGQTYTFQRVSAAHPFIIMSDAAAAFIDTQNGNGNFFRTTTDSTLINSTILNPAVDYTANPGVPVGNVISWTPSTEGNYWYTCQVASHTAMAGGFNVVPEPSVLGLVAVGLTFVALRRRFVSWAKKR